MSDLQFDFSDFARCWNKEIEPMYRRRYLRRDPKYNWDFMKEVRNFIFDISADGKYLRISKFTDNKCEEKIINLIELFEESNEV